MEWWRLVWHKHVPRFSFILWIAIREALSTQDKLLSYDLIRSCLLYGGGDENVDHLLFDCPFSERKWFDMCSECLIPFNHHPVAITVV